MGQSGREGSETTKFCAQGTEGRAGRGGVETAGARRQRQQPLLRSTPVRRATANQRRGCHGRGTAGLDPGTGGMGEPPSYR